MKSINIYIPNKINNEGFTQNIYDLDKLKELCNSLLASIASIQHPGQNTKQQLVDKIIDLITYMETGEPKND